MITQVGVGVSPKPEKLFLQRGAWVIFTDKWSDTYDWAKGNLFEVENEPIIVPYQLSYILPETDYVDITLSNTDAGENLYPANRGNLYQIGVGMKPGNYIMHIYIPSADQYVYTLGETSMHPDLNDDELKYLGAKTPDDTPAYNPKLFFYAIKDAPSIVLRLYVLEGTEFEKCTLTFQINKCKLRKVEEPTEEQIEHALRICSYEELKTAM